jgi:hypothetical protein
MRLYATFNLITKIEKILFHRQMKDTLMENVRKYVCDEIKRINHFRFCFYYLEKNKRKKLRHMFNIFISKFEGKDKIE